MSDVIDRETYVNVSKFIMNNSNDNNSYELDNGVIIREYYYKDLTFTCEKRDGKIIPSYIRFTSCGEEFELHTNGDLKQQRYNELDLETLELNDEDEEFDISSTVIIDDPTIINILSSYVKWRFNVLLKTKF